MAYFLSVALLLLAPAALPAICQPVTNACTQYSCCLADATLAANPAGASINCCQVVASGQQVEFVSPDSGQASVASLTELTPARIIHPFYERQVKVRNPSQIYQPILPQLDPLQETTELLI